MIYYIEYKCYTEYQCCSKVHCKLSLVADALRITVCARERYMTISRSCAIQIRRKTSIYRALKATKARGKECITTILFIPLCTQLEVELIVLSASTIFRTKINTQSMLSDIHTSLGATITNRFERGKVKTITQNARYSYFALVLRKCKCHWEVLM